MPNHDCPPDTVMRVGQIFTDLKRPLDRIAEPLEPLPASIETYKDNWQYNQGNTKSFSIGVYTQFLMTILGLGGDVDVAFTRSDGTILKTKRLMTTFIKLDSNDDYVRNVIAQPAAQKFFRDNRKAYKLYMITGIKIAQNAAVEVNVGQSIDVSATVGVDGSTTGVPIQIGPKATVARGTEHSESFDGSSDFVFAYRVRAIYVDRKSGAVTSKDQVKGALLDVEGGKYRTDDVASSVADYSAAETDEVIQVDDSIELAGIAIKDVGLAKEDRNGYKLVGEGDDDGTATNILQLG